MCKHSKAFIKGTGSCNYGGWQAPYLQEESQQGSESPKAVCWWVIFYSERLAFLVLFRCSTDWVRPTHIWCVICFKFTNFNVNIIPKHPPRWYIKLIITIVKMIFFYLKEKLDFIPKNSFVPKKIYHWKKLFLIPKKVWLLIKMLSIRQNFRLTANKNTSLLLLWLYYL